MTIKKFICLTSAALAVTALTANAEVTFDVVNAYIFRGATINDEVNVQPGFGTSILNGAVEVGVWANFNTKDSEFDEVDFTVAIPLPLGEDSPVQVKIGYTEYMYPGYIVVDENDEYVGVPGADREPFIELSTSAADIEATLLLAYGVDGGIDGNFYAELGLGTTVAVAENLGLGLNAAVGYGDPDEGKSGIGFVSLGASLGVTLPGLDKEVTLGVTHIIETDDKVLEVDKDWLLTLSFAL